MIMQALGFFPYYSMIPNGLMRILSGAPSVIHGVFGEIGVIRHQLLANDGAALPPSVAALTESVSHSAPRRFAD